jgi:hypothetical protein
VGTSATIGINTDFTRNILAVVFITINGELLIEGGMFVRGASITLNFNFIQPQATCPSVSSSARSSTSSAATSSDRATLPALRLQ